MRIAYLMTSPDSTLRGDGGGNTHAKRVIENFAARGHEVFPLVAREMRDPEKTLLHNPEKTRPLRRIKSLIPGIVWETGKELAYFRYNRNMEKEVGMRLREVKPDVVYDRYEFRNDAGLRASKKLGIPHVMELNGPLAYDFREHRSFLKPWRKAREIGQVLQTDHIVVVSRATKSYLVRSFSLPEDRMTVIPNGADIKRFDPAVADGGEVRRKYSLLGKTVVGFVGYFAPYHGVEKIIRAASALKGENFSFLLVGDGLQASTLKKQIDELGLVSYVFITGMVPFHDVPDYLAACDIAVMPDSNPYGSPIKIFEYGAMKKPIIAPRVDPVVEVMDDEKDGTLITPGSVEELVRAARRFKADPAFAERCASSFHRKVLDRYRWDLVADKTLGIFRRLLEQTREAKALS